MTDKNSGNSSHLGRFGYVLMAMVFVGFVAIFWSSVDAMATRRNALQDVAESSCQNRDQQSCQGVYANIRSAAAAEDMADLAVWQFVAGLVGIVFVGLTLKATRDAVREAGEATKFGELALEEAKRAALASERRQDGIERPLLHVEYPIHSPLDAIRTKGGFLNLSVEVFNYGRTPAIITEHSIDAVVGSDVPVFDQTQEFTDLTATGGVVVPGRSISWDVPYNPSILSEVSGSKPFYIFGWIAYEDAIGNSYEHGFCIEWADGMYFRALDKRANFHLMKPKRD